MSEQEPQEPQKSYATAIGVVIGLAGLCLLIVTGVMWVRTFGLPEQLGRLTGPEAAFTISLTPAEAEAEIARLGTLPGETLPATLDEVAGAKVACAAEVMAEKPNQTAQDAAARLFVMLAAARKQETSPLIDPKLGRLAGKLGKTGAADGMEALEAGIAEGRITEGDLVEFAGTIEGYMAADHPLYAGIDLAGVSWAQADFERTVRAASVHSRRVTDCVKARFPD